MRRGEQAALRVRPAHQRLEADRRAAAQRHDRLVVQGELVLLHRAVKFGPQPQPLDDGGVQLRLVPPPLALAGALGRVQREVGLPDQVLAAAGGHHHRDADAGPGRHQMGTDTQRLSQRSQYPRGQPVQVARVGDVLDQRGELVPAQPCRQVLRPEHRGQPLADLGQQLVPGGVPERVVDLLEVVQVDDHHPGALPGPLAARHRLAGPLAEQHPVGQAGQRVLERPHGQLPLQPPPFGHVAQGHHHSAYRRLRA